MPPKKGRVIASNTCSSGVARCLPKCARRGKHHQIKWARNPKGKCVRITPKQVPPAVEREAETSSSDASSDEDGTSASSSDAEQCDNNGNADGFTLAPGHGAPTNRFNFTSGYGDYVVRAGDGRKCIRKYVPYRRR